MYRAPRPGELAQHFDDGIEKMRAQHREEQLPEIVSAEAVGPAHVGVGSDMFGLPSTVIPDYEAFPALEEILAKRRVKTEDIENMLGRNYLRVLRQSLAT